MNYYSDTRNLRGTVRYLGIEVEVTLERAEPVEAWVAFTVLLSGQRTFH